MKKIIYLLIVGLIILSNLIYAYNPEKEQIIKINRQIRNIYGDNWVYGIYEYPTINLTYEFFWTPRQLKTILRQRKGDCTDEAELSYQLYKLKNIPVRKMKGYIGKEKHDYIEIEINDTWINFENNIYEKGLGFW